MTNLVVKQFQGVNVRFETRADGRIWGCLTDMANVTGKLTADYLRLKSTKEYLEALSEDMGIPITALIQYFQGGNETDSHSQGTWAIEEVVVDFARWCSVSSCNHRRSSSPTLERITRRLPEA